MGGDGAVVNEIHARIIIRDRETGEEIREIGEASHAIVDPGEDVQSVHGWRNYVAERVSLAVKATVASELTREAVLAKIPKIAGYCPRCGDELEQGAEILPDPEADGKPAHVACLETRGPVIPRAELEAMAAELAGEKDDAKAAGDDAGGEAPESGAAGAAEGGGEAGAAGAVHPSEEVIELGGSEAGDPGTDPGSSGADDAGSEGAEDGDEGGGEVSRRRGRRRGSS